MGRQKLRRKTRPAPSEADLRKRLGAAIPSEARWALAAIAGLLILVTFAAYAPALSAGFIWDDDDYVTNNPTIQSATGLFPIWARPGSTVQYYPMVFTTFWLEHRIWRLDPAGYHFTNVLLHALCSVLLYLVLRQLEVHGALLAAFAFAIHPVCVESVAWITERKNVLSTFFYLSSALMFLRTYDIDSASLRGPRPRIRYVGALLLFVLALFSKTVTSTLPVALLIVIWWKRGRLLARDLLLVSPMLVLGATLGAVTIWMERHVVGTTHIDLGLSIVGRFVVAGRAVLFYASKLVWPADLTFIYPRWTIDARPGWQLLAPLGVAAAVLALWAFRHRLGRAPLATLLLFIVTLAPALGFIDVFPMRYSFVADHFQYLAMLGPLALVGASVARAARTGPLRHMPVPLRNASLGVVALVLATLTHVQSRAYADAQTLWTDTLKKNPSAWLAHNNLGDILLRQDRPAEARAHFEEALRLNPEFVEAMVSLGFSRAEAGDLEGAIRLYRRALEIHPTNGLCLTNLGAALIRQGKRDEATVAFRQARDARPERAEYHRNHAMALGLTGELDTAIGGYREAVRRAPQSVLFRVELARLLVRADRLPEARAEYRDARATAIATREVAALGTIEREAARLGP